MTVLFVASDARNSNALGGCDCALCDTFQQNVEKKIDSRVILRRQNSVEKLTITIESLQNLTTDSRWLNSDIAAIFVNRFKLERFRGIRGENFSVESYSDKPKENRIIRESALGEVSPRRVLFGIKGELLAAVRALLIVEQVEQESRNPDRIGLVYETVGDTI